MKEWIVVSIDKVGDIEATIQEAANPIQAAGLYLGKYHPSTPFTSVEVFELTALVDAERALSWRASQ